MRSDVLLLVQRLRDPLSLARGHFKPEWADGFRGWSITMDRGSWNVSSPRQPRDPAVPWAVPPSEVCFPVSGGTFPVGQWMLAHGFLDDVDVAQAVEDAAAARQAARWKADASSVWHRCGVDDVAMCAAADDGRLLGETKDAPPVGSLVCPLCLMGGSK